jgi:hypothetical protein
MDGCKGGRCGRTVDRREDLLEARLYSPLCACGGIGRRARLRALWREFSVEVRVLSGALTEESI